MTVHSFADLRAIEQASRSWPLALPGRKSRGRVACPVCGAAGWAGGSWTHAHLTHITCECGKTVTTRGYGRHRAHHEGGES